MKANSLIVLAVVVVAGYFGYKWYQGKLATTAATAKAAGIAQGTDQGYFQALDEGMAAQTPES